MKFIDKMERKFGRYAIKNLMMYIIILYAFGFIISTFAGNVYTAYLSLNAEAILHGQIWRIFTFILQPPSTSLIWVFFALYFYYMIGTVLERIWGAFKFNLYFFSGVILQVIAAIVIYLITGMNLALSTHYLNLALFMAFAMEQPDMQVMLFFILPIKIKWLAILDGVIFAVTIIEGLFMSILPASIVYGLYSIGIYSSPAAAVAALIAMLNFIFYGLLFKKSTYKTQTQKNFQKAYKTSKKAEQKRKQSLNETIYNANTTKGTWEDVDKPYISRGPARHKCAVCGRTEKDDPDLEFRFCSKCKGNLEYCSDHLYTHVHVTD